MEKVRTKEELEKEYIELCKITGDWQYRIMELKAKLDQANQKILDINQEYLKLVPPPTPVP